MRGAPSKSGSNALVPESANPAHPSRTLENWRKSWMHPCVRCVSELLARCVASQPRNLVIAATVSGMSQSLPAKGAQAVAGRSEEHTSELQSLMRISYAVLCLKKKNNNNDKKTTSTKLARYNE